MANNVDSNNQRIAKNAVLLYVRMFIIMIVGLYTSRVVLDVLGVEDFGIKGVVGGVVAMLAFLNSSMSGATSRFLTFELGKGDENRLAETFSGALIIHIGIAILVLSLAETVGLWFLTNKLVIPESRMPAAHWVYQLSIASTMLGITQVPYNSSIIAHEKMDVYAFVEILNAVLKLLAVYILSIVHYDKLILYSVLLFSVSLLIRIIYRVYCLRHYPESHFHWVWKKDLLKPMLVYCGWNLYGSLCLTVRQHGMNFLINIFFGVVFNAASSIATTLQGVIKGFSFSSTFAFRPQIVKSYAQGNYSEMIHLMKSAMSLSIFLSLLFSLPVYMEIHYIMDLWLVKTPYMAVEFVRLLILSAFFAMVTIIFTIGIEATGFNKQMNVYTGTLFMLTIPVMYLFFRFGYGVLYSYYCILGANVLIFLSNMIIYRRLVPSVRLVEFVWLYIKSAVVIIASVAPSVFIIHHYESSFIRFLMNTVIILCVCSVLSYWLLLDKSARLFIQRKIQFLLKRP